MIISDIINESLADWGDEWVHYSSHPMLTVNPKPFHMDPLGIYFFPASHNPPQAMWHQKPYRYYAKIRPDAHILDVGHITPEQIQQIVAAAGITDEYNDYTTRYPPKDIKKAFDMAWELLQRKFFISHRLATFNKVLRDLGYQAIFDDTGAIHSVEPQLLVLDRRIIAAVRREDQKGSGYADMQKVVQEVAAFASQYGKVTIGQITKPNQKSYYGDQDKLLKAQVQVEHPNNQEDYFAQGNRRCTLDVGIQKTAPTVVYVLIRFSTPSLGYGAGAAYSISQHAWEQHHDLEHLRRPMEQIFHSVAETRKLPGPQVAGSGKDFRQNPGINHSSGKMPGKVAGSGKPMKVKPGFVG